MGFSTVFQTVLRSIRPTAGEGAEEQAYARQMVRRLRVHAPRASRVVVAGSIAKGTFLRNDRDLDIFLLLPLGTPPARLEPTVRALVKKAFPGVRTQIQYAEHPYVRLLLPPRKIDVVPAYAIRSSDQRVSAVDRSVLHTKFIKNRLPRSRIADVLLLKKFLKASELYGAEIRVQGFSGYVCELLILQYGGFLRCLRAVAQPWKSPVFIDLEKTYRTKQDRAYALSRFAAPLVVVDPIDRNRNVAAAVSTESMQQFIRRARAFLRNPSARYFTGPTSFAEKLERMKRRTGKRMGGQEGYLVRVAHAPVAEDIVWGQIRKLMQQLAAFLYKNDFEVAEHALHSDDQYAYIALRLPRGMQPSERWIAGPPVALQKNVVAFKRAHLRARFRIRKGKIEARVSREFRTAAQALHAFLKQTPLPSHFTSRAKVDKV